MHIYNWCHSITANILLCTQDEKGYVHNHSPCFFSPCSPCPLFSPLQLTWNPPCCDRIRPPHFQVARKLTPLFPSPGSDTPLPKIPTPQGFPDPNIHSLGRHCEPNPQSSLTSTIQGGRSTTQSVALRLHGEPYRAALGWATANSILTVSPPES